jgi:hypothetical protein
MKFGMYIMAPQPISTAYFTNLSRQSVCLYVYPLPLLDNGSVNMFPQQEELLEESFCLRSVSYQRKVSDYFFRKFLVYYLYLTPNISILYF